jgi:hypothetical protein
MNVLFVRGYGSDMNSSSVGSKYKYSSFDNFFMMSEYNLEYFNYSPEDKLSDVYAKLCDKIKNNLYDVIMGHSMGGGLLLKFLTEHKEFITKYNKIIFLMPIIERYIINDIVTNIPFVSDLYLPPALMFPAFRLRDGGNILNDDFAAIRAKQLAIMNNEYIDKLDLSIINNKNCYMIYAKGEEFNVMSSSTLNSIKNKTILEGKHEMFSEANHSTKFFQTLKSLLENPII